ncbi:sensor histidine kinase [Sphingopyxis chilensis]
MNMAPTRILYIDDDEGIRRLVARALTRKGYEVSVAATGAAGVAMVTAEAFDLCAVDHYMPGMDGLATLEALRALPACPPIVYVTGSEESRIAVAALKSGAEDYVVKSVGEDFFNLLASSFEQVLERAQLRRDRERAEADLRISNARLEALLKEVNHRVANNLQMVMSFIALQARMLTDANARDALQQTQQRIATIAHVNRRLYTSDDVEYVAMDEYLEGLAADLAATWSTEACERRVRASVAPLKLATDKAVALGMIINEWVSNACKYAYDDGPGDVRIGLTATGGRLELVVEDDGIGWPEGDAARGTGLGTKLTAALARPYRAEIRYEQTHPDRALPGTRVIAALPLKPADTGAETA